MQGPFEPNPAGAQRAMTRSLDSRTAFLYHRSEEVCMDRYTIVIENVQHVGMLVGETVRMGNVTIAPVPLHLIDYLGSSGTAAVVEVMAGTDQEARGLAALLLDEAITVLTFALCRQALVEGQGCPFGDLGMVMGISGQTDECSAVRAWRRQAQSLTLDSPDDDSGRVLVIQSASVRALPRLEGGNLARFLSEPATQTLVQIMNKHFGGHGDRVQNEYAESIAFAATCLRHSMESEPPHDLLDAVAGLEALFTPRKKDPMFYPIAAMVGYGVAYTCPDRNDPSVRLATWKEVKGLYGTRSRLVHGDRLANGVPTGVSRVERMLVESIEFCLSHGRMILACQGIPNWLDMARFGFPEAVGTQAKLAR